MASAFKTFPIVLQPNGNDYGLELAVRRRCTKSLFGEEQLRKKLQADVYAVKPSSVNINIISRAEIDDTVSLKKESGEEVSSHETPIDKDVLRISTVSNRLTDVGAYEDWFGSEIMVPRGDRILEQFVVMLLRIGAYLKKDGTESISSQMFNSALTATWATPENIEALPTYVTDTPPLVGSRRSHTASYLRNYPQIFMKKISTDVPQTGNENAMLNSRLRSLSNKSNNDGIISLKDKSIASDSLVNLSCKNSSTKEISLKSKYNENSLDKIILPSKYSIDDVTKEDVQKSINESFDKISPQNSSVGKVETELEMKSNSISNVAPSDPGMLQGIECSECSKSITTDILMQLNIDENKKDSKLEAYENLESGKLAVAVNIESKAIDIKINENKDTVDKNKQDGELELDHLSVTKSKDCKEFDTNIIKNIETMGENKQDTEVEASKSKNIESEQLSDVENVESKPCDSKNTELDVKLTGTPSQETTTNTVTENNTSEAPRNIPPR